MFFNGKLSTTRGKKIINYLDIKSIIMYNDIAFKRGKYVKICRESKIL